MVLQHPVVEGRWRMISGPSPSAACEKGDDENDEEKGSVATKHREQPDRTTYFSNNQGEKRLNFIHKEKVQLVAK